MSLYEEMKSELEKLRDIQGKERRNKAEILGEAAKLMILNDELINEFQQESEIAKPPQKLNLLEEEITLRQKYQTAKQHFREYLLQEKYEDLTREEIIKMRHYLLLLEQLFEPLDNQNKTAIQKVTPAELKQKYGNLNNLKTIYEKAGYSVAKLRTWEQITQFINSQLEQGKLKQLLN